MQPTTIPPLELRDSAGSATQSILLVGALLVGGIIWVAATSGKRREAERAPVKPKNDDFPWRSRPPVPQKGYYK